MVATGISQGVRSQQRGRHVELGVVDFDGPGSYCHTSSGCCYPSYGKPPSNFGIHGLWPNYNNGSYPANCDPNNPFDINQIQDLVTSLRTTWPSLACPSSDSTSFWQHEWDKHGTCSESVMNQHAYFQDNINLKSRINLQQFIQSAGASAKDVLKDALHDQVDRCKYVRVTLDKSVTNFKATQPTNGMEVDE